MKKANLALLVAMFVAGPAHADAANDSRIQQRQATAAREKIHAQNLAEQRAGAPEKLRQREKSRADFAAREKVHAEKLAQQRAAAPGNLRQREKARADLASRKKVHAE